MTRYKHTCEKCIFLGEFDKFDLYYCNQGGDIPLPTVLARFGNDYPDYKVGLELCNNDRELREAKERAIAQGYLKGDTDMKKEKDMTIDTPVPPKFAQNELIQYIRTNKNIRDGKTPRTKIGMIQAFKIKLEDFNDECSDIKYHKDKPFVIIVHSKVHTGCDEFDIDKAFDICYHRSEFMLDVLSGQKQRRQKSIENKPTREILKYYDEMVDRCRRYFKDCGEIITYPDIFDYVDNFEYIIDESKYNRLKLLIEKEECENANI
jgi:hypothetical protein